MVDWYQRAADDDPLPFAETARLRSTLVAVVEAYTPVADWDRIRDAAPGTCDTAGVASELWRNAGVSRTIRSEQRCVRSREG